MTIQLSISVVGLIIALEGLGICMQLYAIHKVIENYLQCEKCGDVKKKN